MFAIWNVFTPKSHLLFQSKPKHAQSYSIPHPSRTARGQAQILVLVHLPQSGKPNHTFAIRGGNEFLLALRMCQLSSKIPGYTNFHRCPNFQVRKQPYSHYVPNLHHTIEYFSCFPESKGQLFPGSHMDQAMLLLIPKETVPGQPSQLWISCSCASKPWPQPQERTGRTLTMVFTLQSWRAAPN